MIPAPPEWTEQAVCAQVDPAIFFPRQGESAALNGAKAICATCPVREECLEWALEYESGMFPGANYLASFGVYGGKSATERRKILQRRSQEAA